MEEANEDAHPLTEQRQSRARFIRQLGVTLAAGIGAIALPSLASAQRARPDFQYQCCPNPNLCGYCPNGQPAFRCTCPSGNFCTCQFTGAGCTNCIG